ncbi:MAG: TadE/TadG family type IV pilus assembly protein [Bryobacteraceae bacterium]
MRAHPSRRGKAEKGVAAIEVGVTVVLLFGLLFLIMDLSMLLFIRSTLQDAVRDGVRFGVTGNLAGHQYLNDSIRQAVQDAALGFLNGPAGACKIDISYINPDTGTASIGTQGDVIYVSVNNYNYTPLGAVLKSADPFRISVSASDILEKCPVGGCPVALNPTPLVCP